MGISDFRFSALSREEVEAVQKLEKKLSRNEEVILIAFEKN